MASVIKARIVIEALKAHARDEAERLQRVLHSPALIGEDDVHLNSLRAAPDALNTLLEKYTPYYIGNYICPRCYIWQFKTEVLEISSPASENMYTCVDCSFMLASKGKEETRDL